MFEFSRKGQDDEFTFKDVGRTERSGHSGPFLYWRIVVSTASAARLHNPEVSSVQ